jgi:hypothetical protein
MSKKIYNIDMVRRAFEEECYLLLDTFSNSRRDKLNYICPKGHKGTVNWNNWQHNKARCAICANNVKHDLSFIAKELGKEDYKLLSSCYINAHTKFDYMCPKGHFHSITWNKWECGQRCPTCARVIRGNYSRLEYSFVKKSFENAGYTLLSQHYINAKSLLNYTCNFGHHGSISWDSWHAGHRCGRCADIKFSITQVGENNHCWRGGISFEPYCNIWTDREYKESLKERDGFKCLNPVCLGNSSRLALHHVDYNKKNCRPDNLITLCNSCNGFANKDRDWHEAWYKTILIKKYNYKY